MFEPSITLNGNLVDDPELRYMPSGDPVCTFRIAQSSRNKNKAGEWADGNTLFLSVECWDKLADNAAASLRRGMGVVVTGTLRQRSYETREGEKRTVYEVKADDVGMSLKREAVILSDEPVAAGAPF